MNKMINYLRHPIVMGLTGCLISYTIMHFNMTEPEEATEKEIEDEKKKKILINIIISLLIGVMIWFGIGSYYDINQIEEPKIFKINNNMNDNLKYTENIIPNPKLEKEMIQNVDDLVRGNYLNHNDEINKLNKILSQGPAISETTRGNIFYDIKQNNFNDYELKKILEVKNL